MTTSYSRLLVLIGMAAVALAGIVQERSPLASLRAFALDRQQLPAAATPIFEKDVLPILNAKCLNCHGDTKRKGDLDLRTKSAVMHGGESGVGVKPRSLKESILWEKIVLDKMPPGRDKLSTAEKEIIKRWIETGAHGNDTPPAQLADSSEVTDADRDFWSFRKPVRPAIPKEPVNHPIDAFLVAELRKKGLSLSPEADRRTLLRRLTFDLIGLPPTPDELEAFLADKSADAYEKVVDRLLASPHYGERWGRHWLDLAGYADSEGILAEDDLRAAAWRYRDYVITAFNSDKPYDRFLQEQLAGDELMNYWTVKEKQKGLPAEVIEGLVATGFLRTARDASKPGVEKFTERDRLYYETLDDTIKIVASSTLGLTIQCAKCHSHKFDPIPQSDYYRLQAIFMSGYRPTQWIEQAKRRIIAYPAMENGVIEKIDAAVAVLKMELAELQKVFGAELFEERLAKLPEEVRDVRTALTLPAAEQTEVQRALVKQYKAKLKPVGAALNQALSAEFPEYKKEAGQVQQKIQAQEKQLPAPIEIRAFYDLPGEAKTVILRRGDYLAPGREVKPGTLAALATTRPFQWSPPSQEQAKTSGRRLAFARWLTQSDHPLTARVLVNRLWLHHFGQGIVSTPDDFGRAGSPPSHPELLDWLACEFTDPVSASIVKQKPGPWSIKYMHRLMVTSAAYRQISKLDSAAHAKAEKVDPENRLLWRQRLRRLEAEALRDAILRVAGNLNPAMFGPPVPVQRRGDGEVVTAAGASGARRSVYLQVRRSLPLTFLQQFDQPVIETNCTRRDTSTSATQALTLLNSDFMSQQAETFADRVRKDDPASVTAHALLLAFGRQATENELAKLNTFLERQTAGYAQAASADNAKDVGGRESEASRRTLADLCQMLLCANEFAYVD